MKKIVVRLLLIPLLIININSWAQVKNLLRVYSPDKVTYFDLGVDSKENLVYRVTFTGRETIRWSALGLTINGVKAGEKVQVNKRSQSTTNEKFAWPLGEDDFIINNYNEGRLSCVSGSLPFNLITRVFNGSVAFRYEIPEQPGLEKTAISKENTSINFTGPYTIYQYNQESIFIPVSMDTFSRSCDFPATLSNGKLFVSVGEADNENYTKAELKRGNDPHSLTIAFVKDTMVSFAGHFQTPWRTISMSRTAIGLHQYSSLFLKLPPAPATEVPAWIKPGKLIRAQLNTQSGLDCIDFAARHQFQYIMFDAGWYGAEVRSTSDPTQTIPELDLPRIIRHGKEKGIGVILYVNYVGLKAKLDTILPLYKKWGVSGMKFGFVDGLSQAGLTWLRAAIKKVNDYGFVLNIHDNYKPTGLSRTYPALLTQEGVRGDENSPDAFHTTVLPFTRFLAGPGDFTFCYPNATNSYSKNLLVTKAQQLALTVVYFSPLQSMFWYGNPNDYTNEEEIEFFKYVPTVWNESHYLAGDIGKNISVARRKGDSWFMGNVAGLADWKSSIDLNFLTKGKTYSATVYEDDGQGSIRKRKVAMKKGDNFPINIKAKGGQVLIIEPLK